MRQSKEIGKEAERTGNTGRQLSEEAQAGVHVGALSQRGDQKAALQWRIAGIVHPENRPVVAVPGAGIVETTLLHPALPVRGTDAIGSEHDWAARCNDLDRRILIRYPVVNDDTPWRWPSHLQWVRSKPAIEVCLLLVLYDDETAMAGVLQESPVDRKSVV